MHLSRPLILAIFLPFALYSAYTLMQVGYIGIWTSHAHIAGVQVLSDLIIACILAMVWMWRDAQASGRTVWPYILVTLTMGSFGPLSYLLLAPKAPSSAKRQG